MDISIIQSDIDFSIFIGRKVTDIIPVGKELFKVKFNKGSLNIECSWRLRNKNGLIIGCSEPSDSDFVAIIKKYLLNVSITNIYHFESTCDLIIEFNNDKYYLDLFSDSSMFEQYQLNNEDNEFLIGR